MIEPPPVITPAAFPPWLAEIASLRAGEFQYESQLQRRIERILNKWERDALEAELVFFREFMLPDDAGRIDFIVNDPRHKWGIECKTNPGGMDTWRQLDRYAPWCDVLVLVTTKGIEPMELHKPDGSIMPVIVLALWKNF